MAPPKIMTGARAKVGLLDPTTGQIDFVGIYNNVSYAVTFDAQPAFILGRYSAADSEYTAAEPVNITASGYRVYGHGAHAAGKLPKLQDLLRSEYLVFVLVDRANPTKAMAQIRKVRPTGFSTTISARNLQEMSMTYMGLLCDDESTDNEEAPESMDLP